MNIIFIYKLRSSIFWWLFKIVKFSSTHLVLRYFEMHSQNFVQKGKIWHQQSNLHLKLDLFNTVHIQRFLPSMCIYRLPFLLGSDNISFLTRGMDPIIRTINFASPINYQHHETINRYPWNRTWYKSLCWPFIDVLLWTASVVCLMVTIWLMSMIIFPSLPSSCARMFLLHCLGTWQL